MKRIFLKGILALCCVISSLSALAIPIPVLPINDFACSQSGGATVTPDIAEACVTWDIQSLGNGLVSYNYSGEAASKGGIVPTFSALSITGLTLIERLVIQIDPTLTVNDIFNPSAGFIGVGILESVYGAIFENIAEEFSVTFETKTLPTLGRFFGLGTTNDGVSFTFDAHDVIIPGVERVDQAVPEPPTIPLLAIGSIWIIYRKASRHRRAVWD